MLASVNFESSVIFIKINVIEIRKHEFTGDISVFIMIENTLFSPFFSNCSKEVVPYLEIKEINNGYNHEEHSFRRGKMINNF